MFAPVENLHWELCNYIIKLKTRQNQIIVLAERKVFLKAFMVSVIE